MKIDCQSLYHAAAPYTYPIRWCLRQCEDLTLFPKSDYRGCLKALGVATFFLGFISIIFKMYQSKQTSLEKEKQSLPVPSIEPYNIQSWNTLREQIEITEEDTQSFIDYRYENDDNVIFSEVYAQNVKFFFGNCDANLEGQGFRDLGWGCAWRSIQTCLSSFSLFYTFNSLYKKYRLDQNRASGEWAEPGYGRRICEDLKISSHLYLYQRESGTAKTPTSLCQHLESFSALIDKMSKHFRLFHTPIMVDDITYAFSILGMKSTSKGNVILWIADPHKNTHKDGLYYLILDNTGKKIHSTGTDNGTNGLATAQKIDPNQGWLLLFPDSKTAEK